MNRKFLYLFFLSIGLASCASPSSHWVTRDQLQPSTDPNIKLIQLVNGSTIIFDQNLGWYNASKQIVEGITITGRHDTTAVANIQQVEIQEGNADTGSGVMKVIGLTLLISLGLGIILGIILLNQLTSHGVGCLVLIQLAIVSAATMVAVVMLFFLPFSLTSCSTEPSHWVSHDQLQPSTVPNINQIELVNGSTIIFNQDLGWYDAKDRLIEGTTATGLHYTTALANVQQVEVAERITGVLAWVLIVLGIAVVGWIAVVISLSQSGFKSGCVVLIAMVGLTATGAAILIFA